MTKSHDVTQPIEIRIVERHDEQGDLAYRNQRVSQSDEIPTLVLPVITDEMLGGSK